ncbi:amino acid ABC transporter substrate-binding protein [Chromobacterium haemolyticum]|uniref:Amino acid ABC transporter substrate-binding protein n=1 Tax=Chromobacterium fluminis TaxID=3044269 RepID=A0ABX0LC51_9NEIS|nr:transporter substrate-binding domain-containing protein [Chromobacterium haemolyticum]NHR06543.1 amino acid ABC transporter substrate-binding protein [Chromobacterium haemolyticum]
MVIPGTLIRPLLAALGACWALSAAAADIKAYTEDLPPLSYVENGRVKGYAAEALRLVAAEAGLSLEIDVQPWLRAYATVRKTPNALLFAMVRTPERETQFQWVGPIGPRRVFLYRLSARRDIRLAGAADARRYRVGALAGSAAFNRLAALDPRREGLDAGQDDAANLNKLLLDRVDLVAMLDWAMRWHLDKLKLPPRTAAPAYLLDGGGQYWFALNPDTPPQRVLRLQKALNRVAADGRLRRLRRSYLGD